MKISLRDERSRFYALVMAIILIGAIASGLVIFMSSNNTKDHNTDDNITLTNTDKEQLNKTVSGFLKDSGDFGIYRNKVTGDNIMSVRYLLDTNNVTSVSEYYKSRIDSYTDIRKKYLYQTSNINYSTSVISAWDDEFERTSMINYNVQNITANIPNDASTYTDSSNVKVPSVDITATTTSTATIINQPVTDSSWNGIFDVNSKSFPNTVKITLRKIDNVWKVYDVDTQAMQNPFAFSFLANVDYTKYNDAFTGFSTISKIDSHLKKK